MRCGGEQQEKSLGCIENTEEGFSGMELTGQLSDDRMFYFLPSTRLLCCRLTDKTSGAVNSSALGKKKLHHPNVSDS